MEAAIVSGVAHDTSEAKVTVKDVPDTPGVAADLFEAMSDDGVNVDMIVQNISSAGQTDISFTVSRTHSELAMATAKRIAERLSAGGVDIDNDIAKVSLVGAGMKTEPGIAARVFRSLANQGINIEMISTSSIRISCVVEGSQAQAAVRALADEFDLHDVREEVGA